MADKVDDEDDERVVSERFSERYVGALWRSKHLAAVDKGRESLDADKIAKWAQKSDKSKRRKKYLFVCLRSTRSIRAANEVQKLGPETYVLTGGTAAWSAAGFERVLSSYCKV